MATHSSILVWGILWTKVPGSLKSMRSQRVGRLKWLSIYIKEAHKAVSNKKKSYPSSSAGKESACNVGVLSSTPGLGRFPGEGHGSPLQYSCLEKSPWTEEPGGLESTGLQRVLDDWSTKHSNKKKRVGQRTEGLFCILLCGKSLHFSEQSAHYVKMYTYTCTFN